MIRAGDGDRTHVASLEDWNITTMLHPRNKRAKVTANIVRYIGFTLASERAWVHPKSNVMHVISKST